MCGRNESNAHNNFSTVFLKKTLIVPVDYNNPDWSIQGICLNINRAITACVLRTHAGAESMLSLTREHSRFVVKSLVGWVKRSRPIHAVKQSKPINPIFIYCDGCANAPPILRYENRECTLLAKSAVCLDILCVDITAVVGAPVTPNHKRHTGR